MAQKSTFTDTEADADECVLASSGPCNKANIFLGLSEYELNSLLGASHLVDYISVHIRFDLEKYLLNKEAISSQLLHASTVRLRFSVYITRNSYHYPNATLCFVYKMA